MKTKEKRFLCPLIGFFAGIVNGFFGTGGGMFLVLGIRHFFPEKEKSALAVSTACIMIFSVLSTILYSIEGHLSLKNANGVILPALLGGVLGAVLLGRIRTGRAEGLFALLLIVSGIRMVL